MASTRKISWPRNKRGESIATASLPGSSVLAIAAKSCNISKLHNESAITSGQPTPLGTLSRLPAEIRDEIYGCLFAAKYVIFWPPVSVEVEANKFAILRTSKQISERARGVLFFRSVFCYKIAIGLGQELRPEQNGKVESNMNQLLLKHLGYPVAMFMRAVEFEVRPNFEDYYPWYFRPYTEGRCLETVQQVRESTLDLWASAARSCSTLRFRITILMVPLHDCFEPFFEAVKAMTGLAKLIFEIEVATNFMISIPYAVKYLKCSDDVQPPLPVLRDLILEMFRSDLKPFLGDSSVGYVSESVSYLEFRPSERAAKTVEAGSTGIGEP